MSTCAFAAYVHFARDHTGGRSNWSIFFFINRCSLHLPRAVSSRNYLGVQLGHGIIPRGSSGSSGRNASAGDQGASRSPPPSFRLRPPGKLRLQHPKTHGTRAIERECQFVLRALVSHIRAWATAAIAPGGEIRPIAAAREISAECLVLASPLA